MTAPVRDWHTDVHTPDASALNNNIRNITGSYVLLYRAVYNLVENAIKYNRPNGSVTVSVKEKNGQAMILVKDTGIGISPENQKKIFDPFFPCRQVPQPGYGRCRTGTGAG